MSAGDPYGIDAPLAALRARLGARRPEIAVVLGSGLGAFADRLEDAVAFASDELPGFPRSTVEGHRGRVVCGRLGDRTLLAFAGRVHYYEGHDLAAVVRPVRTAVAAGARTVILTNAAGSVSPALVPGQLVLVADHLNLSGTNPLRGPNDDRLGPRFPDLSGAYDPALRRLAKEAASRLGERLEEGVYAWLSGPSYETPAEIRMLRGLGADLIGMSTVPEVIAARHMGARVLVLSCVTNLAAGLSPTPLTHEEVMVTASRAGRLLEALLGEIVAALPREGKVGA